MNRFFALFALIGALLIVSSQASATVTFNLFQAGTSNAVITVAPSTPVSVDLVMISTAGASGYGVSIDSGANAVPSNPAQTPPPGGFPGFAPVCGTVSASICGSFNALVFPVIPAGTYTIGTFDVVPSDNTLITTGFFTPGQDAVAGDANLVFNTLMINTPEPVAAALSLLSLGTLGMIRRFRA